MLYDYCIKINDDIFNVFASCYQMARQILIDIAAKYSNTEDETYKNYWSNIHSSLVDGKYEIDTYNVENIGGIG